MIKSGLRLGRDTYLTIFEGTNEVIMERSEFIVVTIDGVKYECKNLSEALALIPEGMLDKQQRKVKKK